MQNFSKESQDVVLQLKTRKPRQSPAEAAAMASAMDAGHKPTMIFSSKQSKRGRKSRSEALYMSQDAPSVIRSRWSSAMESRPSVQSSFLTDKAMGVKRSHETYQESQKQRLPSTGSLVLSSENLRPKSTPPGRQGDSRSLVLNTRPSALSVDRSKLRDKTTGHGISSSRGKTEALNGSRKRASPPPLIPPPVSFSRRQGSVSSGSLSSPSSTPHTSPRSPPIFPPPSVSTTTVISPELPASGHQERRLSEILLMYSQSPPSPLSPLTPPPAIQSQTQQFQSPSDTSNSHLPLPPTLRGNEENVNLPLLPGERNCGITKNESTVSNTFVDKREQTDLLPAAQCSPQQHQCSPTLLTAPSRAGEPSPHISPLSPRFTDQARGGHNAGEGSLSSLAAGEVKSVSPSEVLGYFDAALIGQGVSASSISDTQEKPHSSDRDLLPSPDRIPREGEFIIDDVFSSILSPNASEPDVANMSVALTETTPNEFVHSENQEQRGKTLKWTV